MFGNTSLIFCVFLFLLSIQLILTLHCYECNNCTDIPSCTCTQSVEINDTNSYCILQRETLAHGFHIEIKHTTERLTHIYDPYYVSIVERIIYNDTIESWLSISDKITYGCQTDFCNNDQLLKKLPSNGLSSMLPIDWLNENLQRKQSGDLALCQNCEGQQICVNSTEYTNFTNKCPQKDCQGSCLIDETYQKDEKTLYCYDSACTDDTSKGIEPSEVAITGVYYINKENFEFVQIYIICNAMDCTNDVIFKDIKEKLTIDVNNIKPFLPLSHMNSIYSTSKIFLILILFLQIFILY